MKALASDFDNTLHFRDSKDGFGYIRDCDRKAIARFRRNGNLFGTCSGRPFNSLLGDIEDNFDDLDFHIVSTGSLITEHDAEKTILFRGSIPVEDVVGIDQECQDDIDIYFHIDGGVYSLREYQYMYPGQKLLKDPSELDGRIVTGISGHAVNEEISAKTVEKINAMFPAVSCYQNVDWLDVVPHGISKGTGVLKLKELKQVDLIAAIGDAQNDIPSLKAADVSFTFHDSPQAVKEAADYIVASIAEAIEILEKM